MTDELPVARLAAALEDDPHAHGGTANRRIQDMGSEHGGILQVRGSGFKVHGSRFTVQGSRFRVHGSAARRVVPFGGHGKSPRSKMVVPLRIVVRTWPRNLRPW